MIESVEGFTVGRKRRALSSACIFFHGLVVTVIGALYIYDPEESLNQIAAAWGVPAASLATKEGAVAVLARNIIMVAAVYLALSGVVCMALATSAPPKGKKALAYLNVVAALVVAACSAFHPHAVASETCQTSVDAALQCFGLAMKWHAPLLVLDGLAIAFVEAGPRFIRISDTHTVLLNGDVSEQVRNTTIRKINSHTDLISTDNRKSK